MSGKLECQRRCVEALPMMTRGERRCVKMAADRAQPCFHNFNDENAHFLGRIFFFYAEVFQQNERALAFWKIREEGEGLPCCLEVSFVPWRFIVDAAARFMCMMCRISLA